MLELLLVAIALVGSFAAGLYDLKTTNVPDKVCVTMIILGLILHILTGIFTKDFTYFINSLLYGGLFLGLGLIMYYFGQWGGGDGELLVAIGVLLPNLSLVDTFFPFALSFFINSFFIGAFWSVIFSLYYVYKNQKLSKKFFNSFKDPITFSVALIPLILSILSLNFSSLFSLLFLLIFILFIFYKYSKIIEQGFYKRIPVSQLKVDDMIGENIPSLKLYKKYIKGLTKEQVRKIKKTRKYIKIREGVRYGIVFPLALLFTLFFGDFFLFFF
ncbi:MAG: hypothetical protein GTN40_02320 [Candidatus Aenigmarchaeota archaeon]|nr:hypothetical protein [Candidatus Aenigmarchaeota archaeon]